MQCGFNSISSLVQASSLSRHSDKVNPETAVVLSILPGSHLPLHIHQTLHSACWELSQLSLSSIFQPGWQFRRIPHNSVGCYQFNPDSGSLATPAVPVGVPSSCWTAGTQTDLHLGFSGQSQGMWMEQGCVIQVLTVLASVTRKARRCSSHPD